MTNLRYDIRTRRGGRSKSRKRNESGNGCLEKLFFLLVIIIIGAAIILVFSDKDTLAPLKKKISNVFLGKETSKKQEISRDIDLPEDSSEEQVGIKIIDNSTAKAVENNAILSSLQSELEDERLQLDKNKKAHSEKALFAAETENKVNVLNVEKKEIVKTVSVMETEKKEVSPIVISENVSQ